MKFNSENSYCKDTCKIDSICEVSEKIEFRLNTGRFLSLKEAFDLKRLITGIGN
jgi:hypothetical protein